MVAQLSISALPVWAALNGVALSRAVVHDAPPPDPQQRPASRGLGIFSQRVVPRSPALDESQSLSKDPDNVLLTVPVELVLSASLVDEYAKAETEFRQLLDAVAVAGQRVCSLTHTPS